MVKLMHVISEGDFGIIELEEYLGKNNLTLNDVYNNKEVSVIETECDYITIKRYEFDNCNITKECFETIKEAVADYDSEKAETIYLIEEN